MSLYQKGLGTHPVIIGDEPQQEKKGGFWTILLVGLGLTALIYVPPMMRLHLGKGKKLVSATKLVHSSPHKKGIEAWRALV